MGTPLLRLMEWLTVFTGMVLLFLDFSKGLKFTYPFDYPVVHQTITLPTQNHQNQNEVIYYPYKYCITYDCYS